MKILVTGGSGFIGTNYIEYVLQHEDCDLLNIDIKPPMMKAHDRYYVNCDIMNYKKMEKIVRNFSPTDVVHLAAKTGAHLKANFNEFAPNVKGVTNLIEVLQQLDTVRHAIFTSTMLVCKVGYIPKHDTDYMPATAYGMSKVEGEKIVRSWENLNFTWSIIRPISVWGPWMIEPYIDFFKAISRGWYFHIGNGHYKRSMGYVENIAHEIHSVLKASKDKVHGKTFYVGDPEPTDLYYFAEMVREKLNAPKIRKIPLSLVSVVAKVGDILKVLGWTNVPMSSFRLNNIRTEYIFDLSPIISLCGSLPYNMEQGIERTVEWFREWR